MRIIDVKTYTVADGEELVLKFCNNQKGDTVVGETYIQTTDAIPFDIEGTVDGENYQAVKVFDMANFAIKEAVSEAGYYMIPCAGLHSVKIIAGGAGDLVVKETY